VHNSHSSHSCYTFCPFQPPLLSVAQFVQKNPCPRPSVTLCYIYVTLNSINKYMCFDDDDDDDDDDDCDNKDNQCDVSQQ